MSRRPMFRASGREPEPAAKRLLVEGDTCWRLARATRAAVLIDAASYFAALRASLLEAERSVFILGWELHSRTRIEGAAPPRDGAPVELGALLGWLLKRRKALEIRILLWNHPVFYAVNRELFPRRIFRRRNPERVEVLLDGHLPVGAAHHEKLVIVDDRVAYCGGIDLTVRRWDVAAHHPAEPRRRDPYRKPYVPMHDVQVVVEGEAAAALGERARTRWQHAGGRPLEPARYDSARSSVWPRHVEPDFENVTVGIMRTAAALEERDRDIREIERATCAAIRSARRLIYIENQYITARSACEALVGRMRANPELEVVVVTTLDPGGPLEAETMGVGRQHFMAALDEPGLAERIGFVAPLVRVKAVRDDEAAKLAAGGELSIHVHSKVLVVDDTFLRVGSSNLNNRSMGLDTECDVGIEAETAEQRRAIASVRNRLIAEHWGSDETSVAAALAAGGPVAKALESLERVPVYGTARAARRGRYRPWQRAARAPAFRGVVPIAREDVSGLDLVAQLGDPERVVSADELVAQAAGVRDPRVLKRLAAGAGATAALAALLWLFFSQTDIGMSDVADRVGAAIESLSASPWRVPLVLVVFVLASVVSVPILALIGATVVALGPVMGFLCSAAGTLLAATATFGVGRLLGREPLRRWLGKRIDALEQRVAERGVIAIALIRKVPIAPFTIVNMVIGALGIRFSDFLWGTALGMLPGIAAFAFVSDRAVDAWRDPTPRNVALIAGAVLLWLAVVFGVQWLLNRRARR